ncbi:MAG: nucleoside deaminase, partial [Nitrososphaerales archaeon]
MRALYRFTARTMNTPRPVPFGALIVHTRTGKPLMRATNAVMREHDPSSHAEVRTVRLACKKLKRPSLAGYTMYSTCEPCPMCMANALWARLDRVEHDQSARVDKLTDRIDHETAARLADLAGRIDKLEKKPPAVVAVAPT